MLLTVLELLFLALVLAGVAWWSIPAAMIVAGLVGVAACEYQQRAARRAPPWSIE